MMGESICIYRYNIRGGGEFLILHTKDRVRVRKVDEIRCFIFDTNEELKVFLWKESCWHVLISMEREWKE